MTDTRVAYGAMCTWWDSIENVATNSAGLPCCPICGGLLLEVGTPEEWWEGARAHVEKADDRGYLDFLRWSKGKCFSTVIAARDAYDHRARSGG